MRIDPPLSKSIPCTKISSFLNYMLLQIIVTEVTLISQYIVSLYPAPGQASVPKK